MDGKTIQIEEEEQKTHDPDFWNDPKSAEEQLRKIARLKSWVEGYQEVKTAVDDLNVLSEFFEAGESSDEEVTAQYGEALSLAESLESKNMLRNEEDSLGAILKINSGAGGTESQDWAEMLMRMYLRYGEKHKYKFKELHLVQGDEAGIKSVTLEVSGDYAYGFLKSESGVHRLVRLSPFDSNNRRHTSFASVFVTPVIDESIEIVVNPADIEWDTFRSGGAGGLRGNCAIVGSPDRGSANRGPRSRLALGGESGNRRCSSQRIFTT